MPITDAQSLQRLHSTFLRQMEERSGRKPFVNFAHSHFVEDEVQYKQDIQVLANHELQFRQWNCRDIGTGRSLGALRRACEQRVWANLLHHDRHGPDHASAKSLSRASSRRRREAEAQFYDFFRGGGANRAAFGPRFDALAAFLRANGLGCNSAFLAYLSFVYAPNRYYP